MPDGRWDSDKTTVTQLLSNQFNASNFRLAPAIVSYYTKIIRSLSFTSRAEKTRSFLATSPVKLLSSFLGGSTTTLDHNSAAAKAQRPTLGANSSTLSLPPATARPEVGSLSGSIRGRDAVRHGMEGERPENPLVRLEQTFTGYVAALQSRKGHFVGRTLLSRSAADELTVNDLYNKLIESPFDWETSPEMGADIVFAAFEKFTRIAWKDQMGQIMTLQALDALQERASRRVPGDFADFVNYIFSDMAPQNRRAFTALIKLLADLLEGCGNDGDRGALTLAFAELLVTDSSPHNYINLLDRLVEDCDRIFEEIGFGSSIQFQNSAYESLNSTTRSHKSATGSLTSNTSSLRRKLGFDTLLRQNSKADSDRPSMWRSLSKHHRNPATGESSSLSKASVNRARSIDMSQQPPSPNKLRRPISRDRPPVAGAFDELPRPPSSHRPASSHRLETIGEPDVEPTPQKTPKNKRRSSLSDLKSLMAAASLEDRPPMPLRISKQTSEKVNSAPRIPVPSKLPLSPQSQGLRSPRQKENNPDPFQSAVASPPSAEKPKFGHVKTLSTSNIPMLKPTGGVRNPSVTPAESPVRPTSSPTKSSPQKLRLQSPQKLRERLQNEKKAVDEVDASLQAELSRIGEEMAKVHGNLARSATGDIRKLAASVKALEERVPQVMAELADKQAAVQRDVDASLRASEAKVKAVDQLYKEVTAENELLYERFNVELGKMVKALRGKGREDKEELMAKLKEQSEETARVKKENARLRREMVSLRTLLKGGDS